MNQEYIYGRYPVLEALKSKAKVSSLFLVEGQKKSGVIAEIMSNASQNRVQINWLPRYEFERLLKKKVNHQGVIAEITFFSYSSIENILLQAKERNEPPFLLLLDCIQDVHNFGALLRTAEAAGMHGVIITKRRSVGVTATVYKSSAGAVNYLPIAQVTNLTQTIKLLQAQNVWIVGLEISGEQLYCQANLNGAIGIVVGAEGKGISRLVAQCCDFRVRLPMRGQITSLNASVAGALVIYEALRQREGDFGG